MVDYSKWDKLDYGDDDDDSDGDGDGNRDAMLQKKTTRRMPTTRTTTTRTTTTITTITTITATVLRSHRRGRQLARPDAANHSQVAKD
jgi:hypothetical protein